MFTEVFQNDLEKLSELAGQAKAIHSQYSETFKKVLEDGLKEMGYDGTVYVKDQRRCFTSVRTENKQIVGKLVVCQNKNNSSKPFQYYFFRLTKSNEVSKTPTTVSGLDIAFSDNIVKYLEKVQEIFAIADGGEGDAP